MRLDLEIDRRYHLKNDKGFFRAVEHSESDDGCIGFAVIGKTYHPAICIDGHKVYTALSMFEIDHGARHVWGISYPGRRERFVHVKPDDHDPDTRDAVIRHYIEVTDDE